MARTRMLTRPGGPVVAGEKTLRALAAIRREKLLPLLFGRVVVARSVWTNGGDAALSSVFSGAAPAWLDVLEDRSEQPLPERVASAGESDRATLRLALALPASMVLLDGPIKDRAKLSFIKAEGTLAILVEAFRAGHLTAVRPMVKALSALGHGDVLPPPEGLEALWKALEHLEK